MKSIKFAIKSLIEKEILRMMQMRIEISLTETILARKCFTGEKIK